MFNDIIYFFKVAGIGELNPGHFGDYQWRWLLG